MKECQHKDGWVIDESIVINEDLVNDNIIATFQCNTLGCKVRRKFKFDVVNIEEVR